MQELLLATDGSKSSNRAENHILNTYSQNDTKIFIVSVVNISNLVHQFEGGMGYEEQIPAFDREEIIEDIKEETRKITREAAQRFDEKGYEAQQNVVIGDPGQELCDLAKSRDVDVIVMGSRGRGRVGEFLLGSVSQFVVHHASCAVNIVPIGDSA